MQTTRDENGELHSEIFSGKNKEEIENEMEERLNELSGHKLVSRREVSQQELEAFKEFFKNKTKKQKKANIFQSRKLR